MKTMHGYNCPKGHKVELVSTSSKNIVGRFGKTIVGKMEVPTENEQFLLEVAAGARILGIQLTAKHLVYTHGDHVVVTLKRNLTPTQVDKYISQLDGQFMDCLFCHADVTVHPLDE